MSSQQSVASVCVALPPPAPHFESRASFVARALPRFAQVKTIDICAVGPLRVTDYLHRAGKLAPQCKLAFITSQGGSIAWRDVQCPNGGDYGLSSPVCLISVQRSKGKA